MRNNGTPCSTALPFVAETSVMTPAIGARTWKRLSALPSPRPVRIMSNCPSRASAAVTRACAVDSATIASWRRRPGTAPDATRRSTRAFSACARPRRARASVSSTSRLGRSLACALCGSSSASTVPAATCAPTVAALAMRNDASGDGGGDDRLTAAARAHVACDARAPARMLPPLRRWPSRSRASTAAPSGTRCRHPPRRPASRRAHRGFRGEDLVPSPTSWPSVTSPATSMRITYRPGAVGVTVTPKMPGREGPSVENASVRGPVSRTIDRPAVSGLNVRRSVK